MNIEFVCWNCGKNLKSPESGAGKKCRCTGCNSVNSIPGDPIDDNPIPHEVHESEMEESEMFAPVNILGPEERSAMLKEKRVGRLGFFGVMLLLFGMVVLSYFLFLYDTTSQPFGNPFARVADESKMHRQLLASISSGVTMLIGAALVGIAAFKK